jgi:tetraacyldisaccharide 4'-kinase
MSVLERLWYGDSVGASIARAGLTPPEWLYAAAVRVRGALYEHGVVPVHDPALPVLSVGNLSVGGTGKTPIAAWAAGRLREGGAHPAVLLRGYGDDEPLVHIALNPNVPVIVNPDRVVGVEAARLGGADCVILDDGFQHRRLARTVDWVLVAAERFDRSARMLPAGPLRESRRALDRADVAIVTRKSASLEEASAIAAHLGAASGVETAVCHLAPSHVVDVRDGTTHNLERLRGTRLVAVAAIGAPDAFFAQLRTCGAVEVETVAFRDHHRFTTHDVERIVRAASRADAAVCTLKDAVKLAPLWPPSAMPLWYVSQRAEVEQDGHILDASLAMILRARAITPTNAGTAG